MISEYDVRNAVGPMRRIFWGALIWLIDIKINGFDIANDVLASILVAIGVSKLARMGVNDSYRAAMRFVKVIAYVSVPTTLIKVLSKDATLDALLVFVSLAQLAATLGFCVAMRWFCIEAGLQRSAGSWKLTTILFLALYVGPLAIFYVVAIVTQVAGGRWNVRFGAAEVLLTLGVLCVPLVHFFISTSRMKREVTAGVEYTGHGFEVLPPRDGP